MKSALKIADTVARRLITAGVGFDDPAMIELTTFVRDESHRLTKSIQLWPSGKSITYRWSSDQSTELVDLYIVDHGMPRPATQDEHREVRIAELAVQFQERDVLGCQTGVVEYLLNRMIDTTDDSLEIEVYNRIADPSEWTIEQCNQWLSDEGATGDADFDREDVNAWRDAVRDNATEREVLEWWHVTEWLAQKLRAEDEVVATDGGLSWWWGRTTSGQAYIQDGVLQAVARTLFDAR